MEIKNLTLLFAILVTTVAGLHVASNSLRNVNLSGEKTASDPVDRPFIVHDVAQAETVAPEERRVVASRKSFSTVMSDLEVIQAKRNLRTGIAGHNAQKRNTEYRLKTEFGIDVID